MKLAFRFAILEYLQREIYAQARALFVLTGTAQALIPGPDRPGGGAGSLFLRLILSRLILLWNAAGGATGAVRQDGGSGFAGGHLFQMADLAHEMDYGRFREISRSGKPSMSRRRALAPPSWLLRGVRHEIDS